MAKSKSTKVRQPKAKATAKEPKNETSAVEPEAEPKKAKSEPKAKPATESWAYVKLTGCASLMRHGRSYVRGRKFVVHGKELIDYYKSDPRFEVLEQK